jgi:RimJ/RimL family protein N-acetyltransferase
MAKVRQLVEVPEIGIRSCSNESRSKLIPTLETERLILRPMKMEDWPEYVELMQSERAQFMGGPVTKAVAWGMFCHDMAQWALMGHGALMVDNCNSGQCLGQVCIYHGPLFPEHELGWFVYWHDEGTGVAFEAASAMRNWALKERHVTSLVSYVDPGNARSRNLAERLGAILDDSAPRPDPNDLVFRH